MATMAAVAFRDGLVDTLLDRLAASFVLDREVAGATLRERLDQVLRDAAREDAPSWGSPGDSEVVSRRATGALTFLYHPHLFPELDEALRLGHRVQYQLLPRELPSDAPVEVTTLLESYCHLSGDVFGWREGSTGALTLWLMDVSGHGVEAGLAAVVWKLLVDEADPDLPVVELADRLERRFDELRNPDDRRCRYATAVMLRISATGGAEYLSAGHPPMLLRRAEGHVEELEATGHPLALLPEGRRESRPVDLRPGDLVLLGTDGLLDAGEMQGEAFGVGRVRGLLGEEVTSLPELAERLYHEVERHADVERLDDDLSFLLVRRKA